MVWPGGDQGHMGGGPGPPNSGGWYGYPPPGGPGGHGGPPAFPPPPRRSSGGAALVVAIVVVVIVLVGGGVGVAVVLSRGHKAHSPTAASSSPPPSPPPSAASPPGGPSALTPPPQAKVPGWNAVVAVKHGVAYDAPPSWSVKSPDTIIGFEDPQGNPQVAGSGAAIYKDGYCSGHSGSSRAQAVVTGYTTAGTADDAQDAARKWATFGYAPDHGGPAPNVTVSGPRAIKAGGAAGHEATATVTVRDHGNPCAPPRAIVYAVAVPVTGGHVAVLVVVADRGVSDAAPDADLQKIAGSVRPI